MSDRKYINIHEMRTAAAKGVQKFWVEHTDVEIMVSKEGEKFLFQPSYPEGSPAVEFKVFASVYQHRKFTETEPEEVAEETEQDQEQDGE